MWGQILGWYIIQPYLACEKGVLIPKKHHGYFFNYLQWEQGVVKEDVNNETLPLWRWQHISCYGASEAQYDKHHLMILQLFAKSMQVTGKISIADSKGIGLPTHFIVVHCDPRLGYDLWKHFCIFQPVQRWTNLSFILPGPGPVNVRVKPVYGADNAIKSSFTTAAFDGRPSMVLSGRHKTQAVGKQNRCQRWARNVWTEHSLEICILPRDGEEIDRVQWD